MESFEIWCYRRILNVRWTDKIRNEKVIPRIGECTCIWSCLKRRRSKLIGYNIICSEMLVLLLNKEKWKGRIVLVGKESIWKADYR